MKSYNQTSLDSAENRTFNYGISQDSIVVEVTFEHLNIFCWPIH